MKEFKCPICKEPKDGCCRCSSFVKHDMESLKRGHGMTCKNNHRFTSNGLAYDPKEDKEYDFTSRMDESTVLENRKSRRFNQLYEKFMKENI